MFYVDKYDTIILKFWVLVKEGTVFRNFRDFNDSILTTH